MVSSFFNASAAVTGYKKIDYFARRNVVLADTTIKNVVGYNLPYVHNDGDTFTLASPEVQRDESDWVMIPSFTVKTGLNYKVNEYNNVYFNTGFLSKAPRFDNVIYTFSTDVIEDYKNEQIVGFELGYSLRKYKFKMNVNGYYTIWNNKPLQNVASYLEDPGDPDSDRIPINVNGIKAAHRGIEVDFAYKIVKQLTFEGLVSFGDWIWNSSAVAILPNQVDTFTFDATGVHVGDAAQTQLSAMLRYEPISGLYLKPRVTFFGRNFSNFNPEDLTGADARRESWRMPDYTLLDFHAGYRYRINNRMQLDTRFSILNLLNKKYISDAENNDTFTQSFDDFDAKSASVFFGQGTRFSVSVKLNFR